jgi:hypothetical protein
MSDFSQRGLCHDKSEGEWGIVGLAVLHFCVARKIPYFLSIHRGGSVQYKEASARGIITPSKASGRLLGKAS